MDQMRQGIYSTKPKPTRKKSKQPECNIPPRDTTPSQELPIKVEHMSKLYTDYTGRFPVGSQSGNQYIMIAYHCGSNAIISTSFKSRAQKHIRFAYGAIMHRLKYCNMLVDLHILDNESISEYKRIIKSEWGVGYQLVPTHIHRRNSAERAICTFKVHFLSTLAGIAPKFPKNLWDLLLPQT